MPSNIVWEGLAAITLGVVTAHMVVGLLLGRRWRYVVAFVLIGGLFVRVSTHTADGLEDYCTQAQPHVDCVY